MTAGRFVLENHKGEVVRIFAVDSSIVYLIYRQDTRRVELASAALVRELDEQEIPYEVLKKTTAGGIRKRAIAIKNGGKLRWTNEVEKTAGLVQVADDSDEQAKVIYKYTALTQIGAMLLILIIGLLIEPFFVTKEEETIVTVIPQEFVQPREQIAVKPAEQVDPSKKVALKKVVSEKKPITKTLTAQVKNVRKENAPLRTKVRVESAGVLGVLGGMKNGSRNSAGFNMNASNDSRGSSWNGAGQGGVGGMERAIPGSGLVNSAPGSGARIEGGGGYGTRGKAGGGRAGYGTMGLGGTAAAYFEPVQEEATVEGGLDKDQIAAVINRHIGEVIYCYEKGLQQKSELSGRVGMRFVINGRGQVSMAKVDKSSLGNKKVEGCIASRLRTWQFPKPVGGVNVKVAYPFVLRRVSNG